LLSETNSRPGIEREEDERVRNEVLLDSFVQEPVRIEFFRCRAVEITGRFEGTNRSSPSGPQRSFLRCNNQGT
jgi:hypothetical protein